jgi:formate dehydrogenase major subunit
MGFQRQIDYGTPVREAENLVTLEIDGALVTVPEGTSIMRAASMIDRPIPKLCSTDSIEPFGSCRLCLVEIDGVKGTPASCTTPVRTGMVVHTETARLEKLRRGVMELYISDHPLDCLTCSTNGDCELQDQAGVVGLRDVRYGFKGENHFDWESKVEVDTSNPYFQYDPSKCIVCSRCVRACAETQGTFALTIEGRGFDSRVSPGMSGDDFFSSECVSCGACVQACPTATLMEKSVVDLGVPTRSVTTTCAYCGVGCSFRAELKGDKVIRMVPDKDGGANEGHSCVKGRFAFGYATHKDRVTTPMIREKITDEWRVVSVDEAVNFAAAKLKNIQAKYGVDSIGGITSSRCTNEEVYVVQKMIRAAFGNNNVDTCARVCHSPTGYGLSKTFGTSAGTQDFKSVDKTDVMLLIGANPTDGHPVFASRMKKRLRAGAKIIVCDPRRIDMVKSPHVEAAFHIPLLPGTNVAVMNALAHVIVTEGLVDEKFVNERCDLMEFNRWREFVSLEKNSPETLASVIGCSPMPKMARSITASASPSTAKVRPWSCRWPTLPWRRAISGARASASIRCAGRTMSRAPATWVRSRMSFPATGIFQMLKCAASLKPTGASHCRPIQACASPTCSPLPSTAPIKASTCRARISPSPTPTPSMSPPRWRRWNASSSRTCF